MSQLGCRKQPGVGKNSKIVYKNHKLGFTKMEDSYTIKKINKEGIDWEKIIVKLVYNDELVSSI
jgi:hypothetical protein